MKKIIVLLVVFFLISANNLTAQVRVIPSPNNGFQIDSPVQQRLNLQQIWRFRPRFMKIDPEMLIQRQEVNTNTDPGMIWKSDNWNCDPKMIIQMDNSGAVRSCEMPDLLNHFNLQYHLSPLYVNPPEKLQIGR